MVKWFARFWQFLKADAAGPLVADVITLTNDQLTPAIAAGPRIKISLISPVRYLDHDRPYVS
jgi:hypothetical protein